MRHGKITAIKINQKKESITESKTKNIMVLPRD